MPLVFRQKNRFKMLMKNGLKRNKLKISKDISDRLSQLRQLPNNKAGFQWKVFSIGRTHKIQVDCNMNVIRVLFESTTLATGIATEELSTAEQVVTSTSATKTTISEQITTTMATTTVQTTSLTTQAQIDN